MGFFAGARSSVPLPFPITVAAVIFSASTIMRPMVSRSGLCLCVGLLFAATVQGQQPSAETQTEIRQGILALQQSNFSAAEEHFSRALAADPNLVEVRANLGLAYYADRK
jgi:Tfp pilus assembly protein PilF